MRKLLLFCLFLLTSCIGPSIQKERYEYEDVKDYQISYLDVFNQKEDIYYIYYYQVDCYYCHGIKSKMIGFALHSNNTMYFVHIDKDYGFLSNSKEETIGTNDYLKAFTKKTPQLSLVKNKVIVETYIGTSEILLKIE